MNINKRIGLAVYLYYNRDARKLNKIGNILYHSRRMKYLILYVDKDKKDETIDVLNNMKFVKEVAPSLLDDIDMNFVGNLGNHKESDK